MVTIKTDVLVIGSGFGAAPAALRLAELGLEVTVVEKGPHLHPVSDFKQTQDPKYLLKYLKGIGGDRFNMTYAEALGGGSGFYEMVTLRAPTSAFTQIGDHARPLWPDGVNRAVLDPYYDIAESMMRVQQIASTEVPRSGLVFAQMMKNLGYSCERARYAVRGCIGSGYCVTGCIYGAKQSLLMNYLPQAVAQGALVHTDTTALRIKPRHRPGRGGAIPTLPFLYEVECRRRDGGNRLIRYHAKIVILAGGTVGTAKLLLSSKTYLHKLSPHVGYNIAFNGGVKTAGLLGDHLPDGDMFTGRSHPGMISYEFLASHGITISAGKPMPLQAVASARLRLDGDDPYWGRPHIELMKRYRRRVIVLVAFGMTPPTGFIERGDRGDFRVGVRVTPEIEDYYRRTKILLQSIFLENGCTPLETEFVNHEGQPHRELFFATAHQVGSCRMATSKRDGVCNASGEVFDYPGLFVTDGAAIPTSLAVNTALTILANAERIVAGIVNCVKPLLKKVA